MKPKFKLRSFLSIAGSSMLAISAASAQSTLYWDGGTTNIGTDGNGASAGGAGTWNTSLTNWDAGASPHVAWDNTAPFDTAVLGGTAGTVTLGTSVSADTININTAGYAISPSATNQLTVSTINVAGGGTSSFGAAGTVNIGGSLLTVTTATAADRFSFAQEGSTNSVRITLNESVSSGTSISGPGYVNFRLVANNTTGGISISGGATVLLNNTIGDSLGTNNLTINGGQVSTYTSTGITRALGVGASQIQITGGVSGFDTTGTVTFNNSAATEVVWGSGTFSPGTFVLSSSTLANNTDLNGANRTVQVRSGTTGTMSGVIRNTTGTADLIKEGAGTLVLSNAANSFNGAVTINAGTLSVGTLANGGSNSGLGSSSNAASNLLLGNNATFRYTGAAVSTNRSFTINGTAVGHGASLDASGSGAANFTNTASPAYGTVDQTRTLTLTGTNTGNNILAANIANNGTGAVSVNKTGAGLWVLSGTNTYTGATTLTAGTLSVGASANLGNAASNLIFNGGTLQITGTGLTNFASLGRTVSFNPGVNFGLDIADAGNVFALDQSINLGTGVLTKTGAGTLSFDDGVSITVGALNLNGGIFAVNRSTNTILGTQLPTLIGGGGGVLSNTGSGTVVINNALALQNTALGTAGGGTFSLSGVTTPVIGGLSGATGDLATVISSGYGSVTNLTLNPQSGSTFTYGGVIANGVAGMTLTKTGGGTQILQGANTYTGVTNLIAGTLELSGSGSILNTAGINLTGGGLTLTNTIAETGAGRINTNLITSNSGTITYNNTSGSEVYAETIGTVDLVTGMLNIVEAVNQAGTGSQTLTLSGLTRTGATNTATISFSANTTGPNSTKNIIAVTGATQTPTDQIIGPWATTGTAASVQTKWAVYDASGFVVQDSIADIGSVGSWTSSTTNAWSLNTGTAQTINSTLQAAAVRFYGATSTLSLGTGNLETYGFAFTGTNTKTLASTGGALTTPTGGGKLYLTNGNSGTATISAPINDNGSDVVTLVSSSATGRSVVLSSTTSNYSGGTVLNSGILSVTADTNLGATGGGITFNGGQLTVAGANISTSRTVTVNAAGGRIAVNGNNNFTVSSSGTLTGSGTLTKVSVGGSGGQTLNFNGNNSGFTGAIFVDNSNANGPSTIGLGNLGDTAGSGNLISGTGTSACTFSITGSTALTLTNRRIQIDGTTLTLTNGSATANTGVWTINSDLIANGTANKTLTLTVRGGSTNTFAGSVGDAIGGGTLSISKGISGGTGNGIWDLSSPDNTFTGTITTGNGTLSLKSFGPTGGMIQIGGNGSNVPTLTYTGASLSTSRQVMIGYSGNASGGVLNNNGTGALTFTASTFNVDAGSNQGTRTMTLGGSYSASANEIQGAIVKGAGTDDLAVTKANDGSIWRLAGANTYTGNTTINGGVLETPTVAGTATSSILQLRGGVYQSSGTLARNVNTSAGGLNWSTSSGGFAAIGGTLTLNLNGGTGSLTWNGSSMVSTGQTLIFGSTTADSLVDWQNDLNLGSSGSGQRTIQVNDNTGSATDIARISGVITNTAAGWGILKTGDGTLQLSNSNTYTGTTTINAGTLVITGATQATSAITFGGGVLGLDIASPVTAAGATVDFTGQTVTVIGTPTLSSYTLLTVGTMAGGDTEPALSPAIPGYELDVVGNELRLISTGAPVGYAAWQAANGTGGTRDQDHDNDGVDNGTEHFLGGDTNTTGFTPLPGVVNTGGILSVTWVRHPNYSTATFPGNYGTDFVVETSTTLAGPWTPETPAGTNVIITGNNVTYTFPGGPGYSGKRFARLKVTGP